MPDLLIEDRVTSTTFPRIPGSPTRLAFDRCGSYNWSGKGERPTMSNASLTERNAQLTELLKQAGLDAQARDVAERIQSVLTEELHHRMKNMLTVVGAIVRQTMRTADNLAEAEAAIGTRLLAMA